MASISELSDTGLIKYAEQPARWAFSRRSGASWAVRKIIGVWSSVSRSFCCNSRPDIPPSCMSSNRQSGGGCGAAARNFSADGKTWTAKPEARSSRSMARKTPSSLSTIATLIFVWLILGKLSSLKCFCVGPDQIISSATFPRCAFCVFSFAGFASSAARSRFKASNFSKICSSVRSAGQP